MLVEAEPRADAGRPIREGERPVGGSGEEERAEVGGADAPVNLRWMRVREKMAWEREDWAFISVSFVRRIDVPWRIKLRWD